MKTNYILGISAYYHDSAAALIKDGIPVAAVQEERFSRVRHDSGFPSKAIKYCLESENIDFKDLEKVVYYEDSELKYQRVLSSFASAGWCGIKRFSEIFPAWVKWKRNILPHISNELGQLGQGTPPTVEKCEHHRSHAASAFYPSPYQSAAILCIDGVGEWQTTSIWHGKGRSLDLINSISYPHSLGLLYSAFTYYCGFKVDSGEYKLMGLAPYGKTVYAQKIRDELINIRADGSFSLNMKYFEYLAGEKMLGSKFENLFGYKRRQAESPITQRECDFAASVQVVTEEVILGLAKTAMEQTGEKNLCLAGGVALNCVANGVLSRSGLVDSLWIQPAAGDAGSALGAAMDYAVKSTGRPHLEGGNKNEPCDDAMQGALLGPEFSDADIGDFLQKNNYPHEKYDSDKLYDVVAEYLADGRVIGWFQGRMEFGPRALGARSILGDPRNQDMQKELNLKIKFRESFRPFAPATLANDANTYFDVVQNNPYMLVVSNVKEGIRIEQAESTGLGEINAVRSQLPAITHVDYSARVQSVTKESNEKFESLLKAFKEKTGCSVLVNTSFNVRGEPIVLSPEDAYICFMRTNMEILVLGNYVLTKETQAEFIEDNDWRSEIPLD